MAQLTDWEVLGQLSDAWATGNSTEITKRLFALNDAATAASGRRYDGGTFPAEDTDVQSFLQERQGIAEFHAWNRANPPAQVTASRDGIEQDLHDAILAAPDFAKESAEPILTGAYTALAMSETKFKEFQGQHLHRKTRIETARANTMVELSATQNAMVQSVADMLVIGPPAARSGFIWANAKALTIKGILAPPAANDARPERWEYFTLAVGICVFAYTYLTSSSAKEKGDEWEGLTEKERRKQGDAAVRAGIKDPYAKERTRQASPRQERFKKNSGARKSLREREHDLDCEELLFDISDRAIETVRRTRQLPPVVEDGALKELMRKHDAEKLRKNILDCIDNENNIKMDGGLYQATLTGSFETVASYLAEMTARTDVLRQRSGAARSLREADFLSGFASGVLGSPVDWAADHWD